MQPVSVRFIVVFVRTCSFSVGREELLILLYFVCTVLLKIIFRNPNQFEFKMSIEFNFVFKYLYYLFVASCIRQVLVCELKADVRVCSAPERNVHRRTQAELERLATTLWDELPHYYTRLDPCALLARAYQPSPSPAPPPSCAASASTSTSTRTLPGSTVSTASSISTSVSTSISSTSTPAVSKWESAPDSDATVRSYYYNYV